MCLYRVVGEHERTVLAVSHIDGVMRGDRASRSVVELQDPLDVILRFGEGRDGPPLLHGCLARVVRGERERQVAFVAVDQVPEVFHAAVDVLVGVEGVPARSCPGPSAA